MNRMHQCELPDDIGRSDVIIIRVYGVGTDDYIDREKECLIMRMVHSVGLGAQVYCRYVIHALYLTPEADCTIPLQQLRPVVAEAFEYICFQGIRIL